MIIGTFRIGEDIAISLEVATGDVAGITATAAMRLLNDSDTPIPMQAIPRAANGAVAAGWNITLPAAQTTALKRGDYAIDTRFVHSDGVTEITKQSAIVRLTNSAFG